MTGDHFQQKPALYDHNLILSHIIIFFFQCNPLSFLYAFIPCEICFLNCHVNGLSCTRHMDSTVDKFALWSFTLIRRPA